MDEIIKFLEKQNWIFAKTYAKTAPHEYCLKSRVVGETSEFVEACRYILENGFEGQWMGKFPNMYIYANGHVYWTMHPVAEEVILINRSKTDDYIYNIFPRKKEFKDVGNLQGD